MHLACIGIFSIQCTKIARRLGGIAGGSACGRHRDKRALIIIAVAVREEVELAKTACTNINISIQPFLFSHSIMDTSAL